MSEKESKSNKTEAASMTAAGVESTLGDNPSTSASFRDMDFIEQREHLCIGQEAKNKFMNKLNSDIKVTAIAIVKWTLWCSFSIW